MLLHRTLLQGKVQAMSNFMKMEREAKSLLVGFVGDECLVEIVRDKTTAKEMW